MKINRQNLAGKFTLTIGAVAAVSTLQASTDYGPAIWRPACSGHWYTGYNARQVYVIHDMEGYYASTISYLQGCNNTVSVHYCVNGLKDAASDMPAGEVTQMVRDSDSAWTSGCWNRWAEQTEHEGFASNPAWYTVEMYQASAALTQSKANKYGIPKDRNHIIAHGQKLVPGWSAWAAANLSFDPNCNSHTDPGPYWDWAGYMNLVNGPGVLPSVPSSQRFRVDVNGDGKSDLVDVYYLNPGLRIHTLLSNGDGTWTQKTNDPWPGYGFNDVTNWKIADVNGDGKADLVDTYMFNNGLRIHTLLSNGDGTWVQKIADPWPNYGGNDVGNWKVTDLDGDGKADLVDVYYLNPGLRIHALVSNGDGTWTQKAQDPWPGYGVNDVANWKISDVNGDGKADLVDTHIFNNGLRIHTLLSNGDGTWVQKIADPWPNYGGNDVINWKVTDINNDGKGDLVDVYYLNPGLRIHALVSNGDGTWTQKAQDPWPGYGVNDVTNWKVSDVNNDGKADLVDVHYLNPGLRIHTLLSNGDGTWVQKMSDPWPGYGVNDVTNWKIGDANGDGKSDLVDVYNINGLRIHTLLSNGDGTWVQKMHDAWPGYGGNDVANWKVAGGDSWNFAKTNTAPAITTQPASQTVNQGASATFTVAATGSALTYQWRFNGANISGATASSYTKSNAQPSDAGNYSVVVANSGGSVTSANAALTVNVPPSITTQPASQTVAQGANVTFSVTATGTAPLSYQWKLNGANIAGATASSYTRSNVQAADQGNYTVTISNVAGSVTSANASLAVKVTVILDNVDAGFSIVGAWSSGTSSTDKYGADYRFRSTGGTGANTATWTVSLPNTGTYAVYAWWSQGGNRSTVAPYSVNGGAAIPKNQQVSGGVWNLLGTFSLTAGNNTVTISDNAPAGFVVMADGIKWVQQ